jgi:SAM-dependent methyltransferase
MKPLFIDKEVTELRGQEALLKIQEKGRNRVVTNFGVTQVNEDRWKEAQYYERRTWMNLHRHVNSDHNQENLQDLDNCSFLKGMTFSSIIELGCGPFTNLRLILPMIVANQITLLDPLLNEYLTHPHCSYLGGYLYGHIINCVALPIEEYQTTKKFDLVIMINVLPHCKDAYKVIGTIDNLLNPGGMLVFHEPCVNMNILPHLYDAGHPLAVTYKFLMDFLNGFETVYYNEKPGNEVVDQYVCFAGKKRGFEKRNSSSYPS